MRTPQEIQADIKAHHDKANERTLPLNFHHLAVLQYELNQSIVEALASGAISEAQAAFNEKVNAALFSEPAPDAPSEGQSGGDTLAGQ